MPNSVLDQEGQKMDTPKGVIPAVRKNKDFEKALQSKREWIIILEIRLGQLKGMVEYAKRANKKVLLHIDLIQGLKSDEYGVEFIVNEIKPHGIVSTRSSVVELVKKRHMLAVQRVFLLDSLSLEHNVRLGSKFQPDFIEVLPGKLPEVMEEMKRQTNIPIIAGGLITKQEDIDAVFEAGAIGVSTSTKDLW